MTILGSPSVAELIDLVAAKDAEMANLAKEYGSFRPLWESRDPGASEKWLFDYAALQGRYAEARNAAKQKTDQTLGIRSITPARSEWNGILAALKIPGHPEVSAVGDLYVRLKSAGAEMSYYIVPQPTPGTDADLTAYIMGGHVLQEVDPALVGKPGFSTAEKLGIAILAVLGLGVAAYAGAQVRMLLPRRTA